MSKKIVLIMGSPHQLGNTATALNSIANGLKENKVEYTQFNLSKMNIENCIGCRKCITDNTPCALNDDMNVIFEKIKDSDAVVIASPIYICQVTGIVKTFLDRLLPLTDERHKPRYGKKKLVMLYTYGAPIPLIFNRYIKYTGKSLKAMGLIIQKNIVIPGCMTIDKVKNNSDLQEKLYKIGLSI